jgi:Asp-tRNA(Asn)/Glu-tRNA(Gln) amidotransferase A subunit family amidase
MHPGRSAGGPLRGVPFLLKDLGLLYKGTATTFGSRLFTGSSPAMTAPWSRVTGRRGW